MFNRPYYKETDREVVLAFMRQHPFVLLCGCGNDLQPAATQVPVFLEERDDKLFLTGHITRKSDHHKAYSENEKVLAVFTGPHAHVSASWYDNPQVASTWNYMSVHAKGILRFMDEEGLREMLRKTTNYFENNPHSPANFEKLPAEYVDQLINAIVAFEIEVTDLDTVFKLSQNKDESTYHKVVERLQEKDAEAQTIAGIMQDRAAKLFDK